MVIWSQIDYFFLGTITDGHQTQTKLFRWSTTNEYSHPSAALLDLLDVSALQSLARIFPSPSGDPNDLMSKLFGHQPNLEATVSPSSADEHKTRLIINQEQQFIFDINNAWEAIFLLLKQSNPGNNFLNLKSCELVGEEKTTPTCINQDSVEHSPKYGAMKHSFVVLPPPSDLGSSAKWCILSHTLVKLWDGWPEVDSAVGLVLYSFIFSMYFYCHQ